ncbi:MAG: ATP-binding cassette domain-containing protein, partial [Tissierellaceae bacterium]
MLEIKGLSKSFGRHKVLTDIDLIIEENKIYGLFGRNGVGKTTLLKMISGQLSRNSGEIKLDGLDVLENDKAMENLC